MVSRYSALTREDGRKVYKETVARVGTKVREYLIVGIDLKGTTRDVKYILECPVCSKDKELYPYGSITSNWGNLNKGQVPCGCSVHKGDYTEEQSEIITRRLCEDSGYTFNGWRGEYINHHSVYLNLTCPRGHKYDTSTLTNFKRGHRCIKCSQEDGNWGYYQTHPEKCDQLYLISLTKGDSKTIKVGRSFNLPSRVSQYRNMMDEIEVLYTVKGVHVDIYALEQEVLSLYKAQKDTTFPSFRGGRSECLSHSVREELVKFLQEKEWFLSEALYQSRAELHYNSMIGCDDMFTTEYLQDNFAGE